MDENDFIAALLAFAQDNANYVSDYRKFRELLNQWLAGGPDARTTDNVAHHLFNTLIGWRMNRQRAPFAGVADDLREDLHEDAISLLREALDQHRQRLQRINDGHPAYVDPEDFAELGAAVVEALFGVLDGNEVRITFPSQAMMLLTGRCVALSGPVRMGLRKFDEENESKEKPSRLHNEADALYMRQLPLGDADAPREGRKHLLKELLCISRAIVAAMPVPPADNLPPIWQGVEPARLCDAVLHQMGGMP